MKKTSTAVLLLVSSAAAQPPGEASTTSVVPPPMTPRLEQIFRGEEPPKGVADLRAMQRYTQALLRDVLLPCTVSLGGASGVIVEGGYVLTAAHVSREAGRRVSMTLHDGRRIRGETLGANHRTDAGLIKVTGDGDVPEAALGRSTDLDRGEWCAMLGHPGGRRAGQPPPVRLGRILRTSTRGFLISDCTMSAGDSGGPLFDMRGRVIGINSRIARSLSANMHVPIDAFRRDWKRLAGGEVIGTDRTRPNGGAYLGVRHESGDDGTRVLEVLDGTAAARAGIRAGDVITRFAGRSLVGAVSLPEVIGRRRPGEQVEIVLQRGDRTLELQVRLGRRSD